MQKFITITHQFIHLVRENKTGFLGSVCVPQFRVLFLDPFLCFRQLFFLQFFLAGRKGNGLVENKNAGFARFSVLY